MTIACWPSASGAKNVIFNFECLLFCHWWSEILGEKSKVNDVIFPSGCEARAINLDNKNIKIDIFTGSTSVKIEKYFTAISRYPTGKHEIKI